MKITIEILADDVPDAVNLIREVAVKLKRGTIKSGETVNYCLGDYRVIVDEDNGEGQG